MEDVDVEALLVDDAAPDQATAMAGALVSRNLAALTGPCIILITRQNSYLKRALHSEPRGNGVVEISAPDFRLIRYPLSMLGLPDLHADVR